LKESPFINLGKQTTKNGKSFEETIGQIFEAVFLATSLKFHF